ncbi:hypothetical protein, partial [Metallibacterium sp.]|uniref:hypothetical protein n=1 Tax=Metallibacterium sp. TaxID=2940281 RepID=UPI00262D357F
PAFAGMTKDKVTPAPRFSSFPPHRHSRSIVIPAKAGIALHDSGGSRTRNRAVTALDDQLRCLEALPAPAFAGAGSARG